MKDDYFIYDKKALEYLKAKDVRLKEVIERVGKVKIPITSNLFTALVFSIVGQQISSKAQERVLNRMLDGLGDITPKSINEISRDTLQSFGMSFRKVDYIKNVAAKIASGEFDISKLNDMDDDEVIEALTSLKGIGRWSAEMLMIFSMNRKNVLSFGDYAIQRGLRMIFHHRKITPTLYRKYRKMFSPYCSLASFYIWEISSGEYEGYKDFASKKKK